MVRKLIAETGPKMMYLKKAYDAVNQKLVRASKILGFLKEVDQLGMAVPEILIKVTGSPTSFINSSKDLYKKT